MKRFWMFLFIVSSLAYSQENYTDPYMFFPASVGDHWEYTDSWIGYNLTVGHDSLNLADSSRYIFYTEQSFPGQADLRIDKDYNVFNFPQSVNFHKYRLDAGVGGSWIYWGDSSYKTVATVSNIFEGNVFGTITQIKEITYMEFSVNPETQKDTIIYHIDYYYLAYGFGLVSITDYMYGPTILNGCRINGVTYGTVGTAKDVENLPEGYQLFQNYPNPFNPTTQISFSISEYSNVSIKIYDILGREVYELVNDYFQRGIHTVEFNASNLASGVYFYSLTVGEKVSLGKMILGK